MEVDDEWEFSAEELDFLEREALQQIAQRHSKPFSDSPSYKVEALPQGSRTLPLSVAPAPKGSLGDFSKEQVPKLSVKFFLHTSGNIAAKFTYDPVLVSAFRKIPKATWNAKERLWTFPVPFLSSAEKVLSEISGYNVEIENLHPLVQRAIASASAAPDLRARWCKAIAMTTCFRDVWPVLILTPSSLRLHWAAMIQQWLNIPPSEIVIVIADESHFLKNAQAKRTAATLPIIKKAQYALLLSGTPALSRPIELFKQLEALYPDVYKNVHEYGNRYCKGGVFGIYQGASNHEELHNLMKATMMIRRLKKDVLAQLPVKRRQQVFLDVAEKDMKQINALFRELEVVKGKIKACKSEEEVQSLKFTEKNLINKIYTDSAEAKIPAVLDYLETVIEAGCKFLIFAHHQPMLDAIHKLFLKKKVHCIRIDGGTPPASRQALVTEFQEKDDVKAAVLSMKAGGVGLTLTAASTVIFAELSWTPGDLIQAEDRAHRIGQVSSVNVYYLLANDTVDDIVWDVVRSKLENLGQVLDGHENSLEVSSSQIRSSPAKQKTLDSFLKRCNNVDDSEHQQKLKYRKL
ncbi:chromatin remodeling factor18 [Citrus sinensis]|uniref:Chromatin remodeling factor18 n=1 Tax=Citrus sinensis TaxID=2711 RepID=A0ACB8IAU5_CITSI|nr:chromatin remodeling factor18 [Citrus sinensis]